MRSSKAALLVSLLLLTFSASWSQNFSRSSTRKDPLSVRPTIRLGRAIDDEQRVVLSGYRHPSAKAQYVIGEVPKSQQMDRMILVLRPDPEQESALAELIRSQHDHGSPLYHHWLTPKSFGERFGIAQKDLNQIVRWLQSRGMAVEPIPASRRTIIFSGTAEQVEATFHTRMRRYSVNGKVHFANADDPEIPAALAEVVHGVASLHNFHSAPQILAATPSFTASNGAHFLMPQDWNTIYNVNPLFAQGLDGTGQSIAVLGRVQVALSDVRKFRSNAGLLPNDPQIIVNGADPGFPNCDDEAESALDVEWAGAIAPNATVKFVTSKSGTSDGIGLSAQYAVSNNVAPIISLSYGLCEAAYSPAGNAFWNGLWAQASAQGQSVFVSSGDSGAAGCDSPSLKTAYRGRGVNALCSSPYSTCVGGTQFNDAYNPSQYWSPINGTGQSSALGYIPESAWNESGWSGGLWSTGGGASLVYPKPAWQIGPGVPADNKRDVPDLSLHGSIQDAYVIQIQGQTFYVSGTSAATPSFASVMAMVLQNYGNAQGNINPNLYSLANLQYSAGGPAVFHDVTGGSNSVPGVAGFNAGTGYDLATGLGSIDASLFVNHWNDANSVNFSLASSSSAVSIPQSGSTTLNVTEAVQGVPDLQVTLSASGLPAGVTVKFSSPTVTSNSQVTATVSAGATVVPGNYKLTITGSAAGLSRSLPITLTVLAPDFSLTPGAISATVAPGSNVKVVLTSTGLNNFKSSVSLYASGLPRGVTATFSPSSISSPGSGSSIMTLSVASGTMGSSSTLTVTARGGSLTRTFQFALTIPQYNFSMTTSAASGTLLVGSPVKLTLSTAIVNGFKSSVALSVIGLPKGVTARFSPSSIVSPGSGASVLTLTQGTGAISGTYNLTVKAVGGGITNTQPLSLTVIAPSVTLTTDTTTPSVSKLSSTAVGIATAAANGFNASITFSLSGLPRGVTATFLPTRIASPGNGGSTLTLRASSSATAGTYNLTLTATGGGLTTKQPLTLTVN